MSLISMHIPSFLSMGNITLASAASLADIGADDAGDAGDVAQKMLRMQRRTRGIERPNVFTQQCRVSGVRPMQSPGKDTKFGCEYEELRVLSPKIEETQKHMLVVPFKKYLLSMFLN